MMLSHTGSQLDKGGINMKYFINHQEVEVKDFFMKFYATSLNTESQTNLGLLYSRGVAEALLTEEQLKAVSEKLSNYYGTVSFQKQSVHVVGGAIFEIRKDEQVEETAHEVSDQ